MASFTTVPSYSTGSRGSKRVRKKGMGIIYEGGGEENIVKDDIL